MSESKNCPMVVLRDEGRGGWLYFSDPLRTWQVTRLEDVLPALAEIEEAVNNRRLYAAGFISYEAAPAFDPALSAFPPDEFPLLWFGLFPPPRLEPELPENQNTSLARTAWQATLDPAGYRAGFALIKEAIGRGQTYQVNFTHRLEAALPLAAWDVFTQLVKSGDQPYSAFIDLAEWAICSASPELFFTLSGNMLESKPMKGTARRGLWAADDLHQAELLRSTEKELAENVMITDMVRNDLGRIAEIGGVQVPELFKVERYPTVWQMISRVTARTGAGLVEIMTALFPPASITGAPKKSTMQIIRRVENTPRHVYTGCIGMLAPGRQALFNVAIRTILIDKKRGRAEYGVGGGIVWDADCEREQEECRIKARVLGRTAPKFELLEALLWQEGRGYWLLEEHLQRLGQSAAYFSFKFEREALLQALGQAEAGLSGTQKVRLVLGSAGQLKLEAEAIQAMPGGAVQAISVAKAPVDPTDVFLYHKTTRRAVYDEARLGRPGFGDVLLYNPAGEITESCRANILVELDGVLYTPPVSCGLLGGTYRAHLLAKKEIFERVIRLEEALNARRTWLFNSVRGTWPVEIVP